MIRYTLLILIIATLFAGSCSSRKNKLEHSELIPEEVLTTILTDTYIADGLIALPVVHHWFSSLDSLATYYKIIEKYGYSKETMDNTMQYYFVKNPRKLIEIYDQVLGKLSEMDSYLEKDVLLEQNRIRNLWKGPDSFSIRESSDKIPPETLVQLSSTGKYTFSFSVTLFPDDHSLNPRLLAYTCNNDSLETGKRYPVKALAYIKDGQPHNYTFTISVPHPNSLTFTALLFVFDNNPADLQQNVIIENISLIYSSLQI
jgi:hypothetical protein